MNRLLSALAATVLVLLGTAGCSVMSGQSSAGQYVDDSTITARVKARYAQDPSVAATRISVETVNGVVQLSGFATSTTEKSKAVQLARDIDGVKDVKDAIQVARPQQ